MAAVLGSLAVKINSVGLAQATKGFGALSGKMGAFVKKMGPAFQKLTKSFKIFGGVATAAFFALAAASPLLRARMEVLNLRINELLRTFGDALAPIIEIVTGLVETAIEMWNGLPEPLQQAIIFGTQVAAVVGLVSVAFTLLSAAMSPVTLIILGIVAAAALLYLAWTSNFLGIQDITKAIFEVVGGLLQGLVDLIMGIVEVTLPLFQAGFEIAVTYVQNIFEGMVWGIQMAIEGIRNIIGGIIDFIKGIFSGDLEGALDGIKRIFKGAFEIIVGIMGWPIKALQGMVDDIVSGKMINQLIEAGKALFGAIIKGIQDAVDAAVGVVADLLEWFAGWFGGSLPEKGPLKMFPQFGKDLGKAYVQGVVGGMQETGLAQTFNRTFNIERVVLEVPGITESEGRSFANRLDTGLRRATF